MSRGSRKSAEVLRARALVLQGMSGYKAALATGVSQSAISRDAEVQKYRQEKKRAENNL